MEQLAERSEQVSTLLTPDQLPPMRNVGSQTTSRQQQSQQSLGQMKKPAVALATLPNVRQRSNKSNHSNLKNNTSQRASPGPPPKTSLVKLQKQGSNSDKRAVSPNSVCPALAIVPAKLTSKQKKQSAESQLLKIGKK